MSSVLTVEQREQAGSDSYNILSKTFEKCQECVFMEG